MPRLWPAPDGSSVFLKVFASESASDIGSSEAGHAEGDAGRLAELDKAIAALPAIYKEPLLLTTVSGLSHQEAAKMLGTTVKAIEMRLYRARRKIQEAMSPEEGEG